MKLRRTVFLTVILTLGGLALAAPALSPSPLDVLQNWGLVALILAGLVVAAFFFEFEKRSTTSKEIALVAILATIAAVIRIPFAAVPSVQPSTYLIICTGYVFGPLPGFMVGAVTALVSNFFLGQGPWTIYQMFAWGLAGVSAAYFARLNPGRRGLAAFGVLCGYLFGIIMNVWFWAAFVYPLTPRTFLVSQLGSLWFDTAHAAANAIFLSVFGPRTIKILERFREKFQWEATISELPSVMETRSTQP
jgi:energy-coupling factor transport system substrate-specific component